MSARYFWIFVCSLSLFSSCGPEEPQRPKIRRELPQRQTPPDDEINPEIPPPPAPYTGPKKFCFEKQEGENSADITTMIITVVDNDSAYGTVDFVSPTAPARHAAVNGMMLGNQFRLLYTGVVNGQNYAEELIYKFENNKLFRKSGEMVLKDGVMVLDNPFRTKYVLSFEKVDCD